MSRSQSLKLSLHQWLIEHGLIAGGQVPVTFGVGQQGKWQILFGLKSSLPLDRVRANAQDDDI